MLERLAAKTRASAGLFPRAPRLTPGGGIAGIKCFEPCPIFMRRASESHAQDLDGNQRGDYLMSYGAPTLGSREQAVISYLSGVLWYDRL